MRVSDAVKKFESLATANPQPRRWREVADLMIDGKVNFHDVVPLVEIVCDVVKDAMADFAANNCNPESEYGFTPWGRDALRYIGFVADNVLSNISDRQPVRLEDAIKHLPSVAELDPVPTTWEEAMTAVVNGSVNHDDISPLVIHCCRTADAGRANSGWRRMQGLLVHAAQNARDIEGLAEVWQDFVSAGRHADATIAQLA